MRFKAMLGSLFPNQRLLVSITLVAVLGALLTGGCRWRARRLEGLSQHAMALAKRDGAQVTVTNAWHMVWVDLRGGSLSSETARAFVNATQITDLTTSPPPSQEVQLALYEGFGNEGQLPDRTLLSWVRSPDPR